MAWLLVLLVAEVVRVSPEVLRGCRRRAGPGFEARKGHFYSQGANKFYSHPANKLLSGWGFFAPPGVQLIRTVRIKLIRTVRISKYPRRGFYPSLECNFFLLVHVSVKF